MKYKSIWDALKELDPTELGPLRDRMNASPGELMSHEAGARLALRDTLQEIFRVERGEAGDHEGLWRRFFEGTDSAYLFFQEVDAWPDGKRPWKDSLRARLKSATYSQDETLRVIDEISERPLYWREVRDIVTLVDNRYLKFESVRLYGQALQQFGAGDRVASAQTIREIATLASVLHEERARYRGVDLGPLKKLRDAASLLAKRLESPPITRGPPAAEVL